MKKHEAKVVGEEQKYCELRNEMEQVIRDKKSIQEAKEAIHATYDD